MCATISWKTYIFHVRMGICSIEKPHLFFLPLPWWRLNFFWHLEHARVRVRSSSLHAYNCEKDKQTCTCVLQMCRHREIDRLLEA
jgi:hypothetical protein